MVRRGVAGCYRSSLWRFLESSGSKLNLCAAAFSGGNHCCLDYPLRLDEAGLLPWRLAFPSDLCPSFTRGILPDVYPSFGRLSRSGVRFPLGSDLLRSASLRWFRGHSLFWSALAPCTLPRWQGPQIGDCWCKPHCSRVGT